jgi:hypothetical protein
VTTAGGHEEEQAMALNAEQIRQGLRKAARGKHGDGDMCAIADHLANVAEGCDDDELLDMLEAVLGSLEEWCKAVRDWIKGDRRDNPLGRGVGP